MAVSPSAPAQIYAFDRFELDLGSFSLRGGTEEISLEPQVMSLLAYFVQHSDTLVTREELLDELWGHRYVSESAVPTQIKTLRKALGDDGRHQRLIRTVHGRGYRFVAPVTRRAGAPLSLAAPADSRNSNLGYERNRLIGRDDELKRCIEALENYRLVSLLGIGGTGKTRLAKAVGRAVASEYPDGVWFVDLVPVRDGAGIDTAIASAMGISMQDAATRSRIAAAVKDRQVLFILDNCEHIEDEVAAALDFMLENTSEPKFLATSRDPIDLADELRFFVEPLPVYSDQGVAPAVELFVTTAERHGVVRSLLNTDRIQPICARLDGLPLAIELAAAQLKQLTVEELADRLDRRFELLTGRQRTGGHRQDSLIQVVENTWQLLNEEEQRLLGQIALFPGQFTVNDIEEVFAGELPNGISFAMSRLVELCLLSRTSRRGGWWQLLETVRLFTLEKMSPQERQTNTRRHAEWVLGRLGVYPEDHLHNFDRARWFSDHYSDLTAAELYFESVGRRTDAVDVCCAVGLMIQLDDGARAVAKLKRIGDYVQDTTDTFQLSQLHGMAGLCAQATRNPQLLAAEAEQNLSLCRQVGEANRLAAALILSSLTKNFVNPEQAREELREATEVATRLNHAPTIDLVTTYRIWSDVVTGELESAEALARPVTNRLLDADRALDSPTYNTACALAACLIFRQPEEALACTRHLLERPEAHSLWGASLLYASVFASVGDAQRVAGLIEGVESRLRRAGRSPWPDLLVPAIVLAHRMGESDLAAAWLGAVRASRQPQQTFHSIAVYRQLRTQLTPASDAIALADAGSAALEWVRAFR